MSEKKESDETTAADERNPFATPERVAESADGWEDAAAPPTVGPDFCGAFEYCRRPSSGVVSRSNRTVYFGWHAALVVALFTLGFAAGLGTLFPFAWARATKGIPFVFLGAVVILGAVLPVSLASAITGAAIRRLRRYDRDGEMFLNDVVSFVVAFLFALGFIMLNLSIDGVFDILRTAFLAAVAATLFWTSTIFITGFCCAASATIPGEETSAFLTVGALIILLGLLVRVVRYCRVGTPGPNRFGAERLTPKDAARREREKNAENGLIVENETV